MWKRTKEKKSSSQTSDASTAATSEGGSRTRFDALEVAKRSKVWIPTKAQILGDREGTRFQRQAALEKSWEGTLLVTVEKIDEISSLLQQLEEPSTVFEFEQMLL